jgi:rubrerythrin
LLSARSFFQEICEHDESYRLFLSLAAKGEDQGGWENERIAELTPDHALAAKIARHGSDEAKHARIFSGLLKRRGLDPVSIPDHLDYTMRLEREGVGLAHARLREDRPLSDEEVLAYLAHSRVTEQRGREEIFLQARLFPADTELGRAIRVIADDEVNHLSYCNEELAAFAARGHDATIQRLLRRYALTEIRTYRDVGLGVVQRMGEILGWPAWRKGVLYLGLHALYAMERAVTWRRLVRLEPPERPGALAAPAVPASAP